MTTNSKLFGGSPKIYWSLSRELQQLDADCDQQNLKLFEGFGKLSVFSKDNAFRSAWLHFPFILLLKNSKEF